MKRLFFVWLILSNATLAADPFACVDPEFATAFLGTGFKNRPVYSTELPSAFDGLRVPDSLELVGSSTNSFIIQAVYKTTADSSVALDDALNLLLNNGWRNLADIMAMHSRGFQSGLSSNIVRVCRNTEPGMLSINVNNSSDQTYFSYSMSSYGNGQTCDDMEAQSSGFRRHGMSLMNDLPVLELPEDAQSSGGGSGGGGDEYHSSVVVMTNMSRASLVQNLGDQVRSQGWAFDTEWSGDQSSGSIWTKKSSDDELLIGTLHAYGEEPNTYHVRIGIALAKTGGFAAGPRIGNQAIRLN